MRMKLTFAVAVVSTALMSVAGPASAGCGKGAIAGGVVGHVAGKHGIAGAAIGCAIGHHAEKKKQKQQAAAAAAAAAAAPVNAAPANQAGKARK